MLTRPDVSVIICTLDRVDDLSSCLNSLSEQEGIDRAEILVINDGTTDRTEKLAKQWGENLRVRYIVAGLRNLGKARNLGIQSAAAPIVAFLDDDAVVEPGWLNSLAEDFLSLDEVFAGQTGPVEPNGSWETAKEWLHPDVARQVFSLAADRPDSGEMHYPDCLLGCNMAFRRDFLVRCGGFTTQIQNYDEASVVWPAMKHGSRFYFNRRMRARHRVDVARLAPQYLWRKFRAQGAAFQRLLPTLRRHGIYSLTLNIAWDWIRPVGGYLVSWLLRNRQKQTAFAAQLAFWFGRLQGLRGHNGDYYERSSTSKNDSISSIHSAK